MTFAAATSYTEPAFLRTKIGARPWVVGAETPIPPLACSPDGRFAAGSLGRVLWIVDLATGVIVRWIETGSHVVFGLCFSPDGARLYAAGDWACGGWHVATGERLFYRAEHSSLPYASVSSDGLQLAVDSLERLLVIDLPTSEVITLRAAPNDLRQRPADRITPTFSADGAHLLTSDTSLRRWDLEQGTSHEIAAGMFTHACRLADGSVVASRSDGSLERYDISDGRLLAASAPQGAVRGLIAQGERRRVLLEIPNDYTSWIVADFEIDTLSVALRTRALVPTWTSIAIGGGVLCSLHAGALRASPLSDAGELVEYPPRGRCLALRFDADATHIAAIFGELSRPQSASRWNLSTGALVGDFAHREGGLRLGLDGASVLALWRERANPAALTTLDEASTQTPLGEGFPSVSTIALGRGGRFIAIASQALRVFPDGPSAALPLKNKLDYQPLWDEEAELLVAHDYKRLVSFDLRTMTLNEPISVPKVRAIVPWDGRVWALTDKNVQLWDVRARTKVRVVKLPQIERDLAMSFAVSSGGRTLAVGLAFGGVILMDLDGAGRFVVFPAARGGSVSACAFSEDGALLATGSSEPLVRVWDVEAALATGVVPAAKKKK